MDTGAIFGWIEILDNLDYYELLNVEPSATVDDVKRAFHTFATTFHPDGHPGRIATEREALDAIFKRGTEAYMVLSDPAMRSEYDRSLLTAVAAAPPRMQTVPPASMTSAMTGGKRAQSQLPPKLEDKVRGTTARPFARRAEELVEKGDFRQAKLQMVMATHMDPENDALESYLRHIEDELKTRR
jgi:curved DNA-binding protein CbpA